MKKLLVVVDYQQDFVSGTLGFPGAELLEPGIVNAVEQTLAQGGYVLFTRDTHPASYSSTREGQFFTTPHCIEHTPGHQLYGQLHQWELSPPPNTRIINKPTFGCNDIGEQAFSLCGGQPDVIQICGLVTDICVVSNTILLHSAFLDASIQVLASLCGSANQSGAQAALQLLAGLGIQIIL